MKTINKVVAIVAFSLVSFGSFAQSVTACASTIDEAEAKIAIQAKKAGASYKITESNFNNGVHMTATLIKSA